MESFDAVIVGGGPAGSTCARFLTRAGLRVAVLDKSFFPRDKICAGWITPQVIAALELDVDDYKKNHVLQPITAFMTGLVKALPVRVAYDEVISYGIRRCEFDDYLLKRSGAHLRLGQALKKIERQNNLWLLNDAISTPLLIGAGGHFCPVAQFLGASLGRDELALTAQEIEFEMTATQAAACRVMAQAPELYFCDDLQGYGWCFRKGNYLNVGLGREDNHHLTDQVKIFWEWLAAQGKVPDDMHARFKGHAYLVHPRSTRSSIADHALLIGDAAGLAYAQSGEGIRPAVESGILAAQTIVAAHGDYSRKQLASYETALHERFGARPIAAPAAVPSPFRMSIARALLKTRWFSRHVLLNRWFLHRHEPTLAINVSH